MISADIKRHEAVEPLDETHAIIQPCDGYRFGADAVALASFAADFIKREHRVFDMCSGCGIVGILVAIACGCAVDGAELDGELWDMSVRSAAMNELDNVNFFNADIRDVSGFTKCGYDAVVCNPPYFKAGSVPSSVAPSANSELSVTLRDVISAAKYLLKPRGGLYLVYTSTRLDEAVTECRDAGFAVKNITVLGGGKTFLLRAVRGGKPGMTLNIRREKQCSI